MSEWPFSETAEQVERAAQGRLVAQAQRLLDPLLDSLRAEALARAFRPLDRGEPLDPQVAIGLAFELYAVEKLERRLRKLARRSEPAQDPAAAS
jgi:hypothetical protein